MDEIAVTLGQTLCTIATVGGAAPCYNAGAMQMVGYCFVVVVLTVTLGFKVLSRS